MRARTMKRKPQKFVRLYEFFALRVKNVLSEQGIRYDVVDAVMAPAIMICVKRLIVLQLLIAVLQEIESKISKMVDAFNRV